MCGPFLAQRQGVARLSDLHWEVKVNPLRVLSTVAQLVPRPDLSGEPTAGRVGLPYPARPAPLTFAKWFPCTAVIRKGRILASSQLELRTQVCHAAVALDPVAVTAQQLQVFGVIRSTLAPRDDVVYL